jgi:hypothetical protein
VLVEKPMAADLAGAEALLAAARTARLPLMVSWPTAWRPAIRHGLDLTRSGRVGEPVQLSHRGGHAGPREFGCSPEFSAWLYDPARNGGGALVLFRFRRPRAVTAVTARFKAGLRAEDTAVVSCAMRAVPFEASWTQIVEPASGWSLWRAGRSSSRRGRPAMASGRTGRCRSRRRADLGPRRGRARRTDVLPACLRAGRVVEALRPSRGAGRPGSSGGGS